MTRYKISIRFKGVKIKIAIKAAIKKHNKYGSVASISSPSCNPYITKFTED